MSIASAIWRGDQRSMYRRSITRLTCAVCSCMKSHMGASCSLSPSGRWVKPSQSTSRCPALRAAFRCAIALSVIARRMFSRREPSSTWIYASSSASCSTSSASSLEPVAACAMRYMLCHLFMTFWM